MSPELITIETYKAPVRLKTAPGQKKLRSGIFRTKKRPKKLLRAIRGKKKEKKFKQNIWAEFGLDKPKYIRYAGYGGVLWWVLSQYVRKTEFHQYQGLCVDGCGRQVEDWREADCGHFRSAKSLSTRFLRENLGLQTKYCNSPRGGNGNQYGFGKTIDVRYGAGTADSLTTLAAQTSKPYSKDWYRKQITLYLGENSVDKQ